MMAPVPCRRHPLDQADGHQWPALRLLDNTGAYIACVGDALATSHLGLARPREVLLETLTITDVAD